MAGGSGGEENGVLEKEKNNNAPKDIHALILKTCENVPLPCYKHMTKEMLQM